MIGTTKGSWFKKMERQRNKKRPTQIGPKKGGVRGNTEHGREDS